MCCKEISYTAKIGTTASVSSVARDGEDDVMFPTQNDADLEENNMTRKDKVVRFGTEFYENNVLCEIFSEESLLEKRRKSFTADMKMFAMFGDSDRTNKDGISPK